VRRGDSDQDVEAAPTARLLRAWCWGALRRAMAAGVVACAALAMPASAIAVTSTAISAGEAHACALTSPGGVKCWGAALVGDGTTKDKSKPVDVSGLTSGVTAISAGDFDTCALTSVGGVKCWGDNGSGQVGDGTTERKLTPVDVSGLTSGVAAISSGSERTCALTTAGGVKCWGAEVGDGTTGRKLTPVDVTGLTSGVTAISARGFHTCALTSAGGVKCWGVNTLGQIGDGTTTDKLTPVDVSGLTSGATAISGGYYHACALMSTGGVKCWGEGGEGQLGDGSTTGPEECFGIPCSRTPVDVSGLSSGVKAISAGGYRSCALTGAGGAKCWGGVGPIGDGTTERKATPVDITGLTSGVAALSAGGEFACALTSAGGVKCWGVNERGQVGDGTERRRTTPVDVSGLQSAACSGNSASITLAPGLTNTPAVQTLKIKGMLTGCTGAAFTTVKYAATLRTPGAVSCSVLTGGGGAAAGAAKFAWTPKAKSSIGTLSLPLSDVSDVSFSGEVTRGSYSPLAISGSGTESYVGAATCATKKVKKGTLSGSAVGFE
jgi:alpha-tubulin suppressor-like RCC1 family protein